MKIKNIRINNYGNLENKEIKLGNKINIIYGENESGKSTLLNYVKNIFYGISKNKNGKEISDYEKYKPWGKEDYSGKLKYELDNGKEYEIIRDFNKKNPKIYNEELEDISKEFNIDKKDGMKFFYDQTGVDETMFTSTVLSVQQEVRLDSQEQNILIQKLANLAGTGDDNLSYKKVIDKLNKKQIEEIGSDRSQGRPINIVKDRIKNIQFVLKELQTYQKDKEVLEVNKIVNQNKIKSIETKIDILRKLNCIRLCKINEEQKVNIKEEYKTEKENKINELNFEKERLNKEKQIGKKGDKINIKKHSFIIILILIFNVLIFIFNKNNLKNNLINIFNFLIIPIYLIIIFGLEKIKNKKRNKIIKIKMEKTKNEINLINKQIEILIEEKNKIEKEIEDEQRKIDNKIKNDLEKIKKEFKNKLDVNEYLDKIDENKIENDIYKLQEELNKCKIELQSVKIQEEDKTKKLENMASLKEEYELLVDELHELEEKNETINLTKDILNKAYIKMKNNITPRFTQNLSNNIKNISNNKYSKVGINDEKGLIIENEYGDYVPVERLSIGTIDQLYLSLRLSMIDDLSNEKMPILLDETFAYFDDARLEKVLNFLNENMCEHQIIIFTCTKREKEILDRFKINYNLVEM